MAFLTAPHKLDRTSGCLDEQCDMCLDGDIFLAAEAAAHHTGHVAHMDVIGADNLCDCTEVLKNLSSDTECDNAILIHPADAALCLQISVIMR